MVRLFQSSETIIQPYIKDATFGYFLPIEVDKDLASHLAFMPETSFVEPNRDIDGQTQGESFYGNSNTLIFKADSAIFFPPSSKPSTEFSRVLQKWEGYVTEVTEDTFWARLIPIIGEGPEQEAEIFKSEVDPDDQSLLQPGAVFYWSIGYHDRPAGRLRASIIRFRRLPIWTKHHIQSVATSVSYLEALLDGK